MSHLINAFPECPKCDKNIFSEGPLFFTYEAIKGVYYDEGDFEAVLSFDNPLNLKVDSAEDNIIAFEKNLDNHLPSFNEVNSENIKVIDTHWEEDNLIEYVFTCPHCDKKIKTYSDNPDTFKCSNLIEDRINEVYDEKIHIKEKVCLSLNELIENTKCSLFGKQFKVSCMFLATSETFKHRGAPHEEEAYSEEDMIELAEGDDNIEHGVARSIIYVQINTIQ